MITSAFIDGIQVHGGPADIAISTFVVTALPREKRSPRARAHGEINRTRYYGGALYSLTGFVRGASIGLAHEALDLLRGLLRLPDEHEFRFRREGLPEDEVATIRLASAIDAPLSGSKRLIRWGCELLASDPRMFTYLERSGAYDPTLTYRGIGVAFPVTFPAIFTGTAEEGELVVDVGGNFPTPARFTVSGPASAFTIDNLSSGEAIVTTAELDPGDTLVIDTARRVALLNGTSPRPDWIDAAQTDWFELAPGQNRLRLTGSGFGTGATSLSVTYRDARIP